MNPPLLIRIEGGMKTDKDPLVIVGVAARGLVFVLVATFATAWVVRFVLQRYFGADSFADGMAAMIGAIVFVGAAAVWCFTHEVDPR